jgi:hypothetical protein
MKSKTVEHLTRISDKHPKEARRGKIVRMGCQQYKSLYFYKTWFKEHGRIVQGMSSIPTKASFELIA